jgi:hypothetical protein
MMCCTFSEVRGEEGNQEERRVCVGALVGCGGAGCVGLRGAHVAQHKDDL